MNNNTHTENVHSIGVTILTKDFRGHESWFASNMGGDVFVYAMSALLGNVRPDEIFIFCSELHCRAEVGDDKVTVVVDENVVHLEVVVNDALFV